MSFVGGAVKLTSTTMGATRVGVSDEDIVLVMFAESELVVGDFVVDWISIVRVVMDTPVVV